MPENAGGLPESAVRAVEDLERVLLMPVPPKAAARLAQEREENEARRIAELPAIAERRRTRMFDALRRVLVHEGMSEGAKVLFVWFWERELGGSGACDFTQHELGRILGVSVPAIKRRLKELLRLRLIHRNLFVVGTQFPVTRQNEYIIAGISER